MEQKVRLLNPIGEVRVKREKLAARSRDLSRRIGGFLDNSKYNANFFLERLAKGLSEKFKLEQVVWEAKPRTTAPAPTPVLDRLSQACAFVVTAFGD